MYKYYKANTLTRDWVFLMFRSVCNSFIGRCHHTMRSNGPHHRKEGSSTAGGCCSRWDQQLGPITAYKIKTHRHSSKCKVVYWKCKKIFWSTSTVNPKTTEKLQRALESNFKTQMGPKLLLAHLLTISLTGLCTELCPVFALCCFRLSKAHVWQLPRVWWSSAELPGLPSGVWWWALPRHSTASPSQPQCCSGPLAAGSLLRVSIHKSNSFGRELPVEKEEFGNILFLLREQENALRAKTQSDMMHQAENRQEVLMFIFNWKHPTSRGYSNFF